MHRPDGRDAPDWAAKIHVALAPVYYQNYLYGELVASQLQATLRARAGGIVDRPAAGALLVDELFAPGLKVRWDALVEQVTGEPLTARHLAAELGVAADVRHALRGRARRARCSPRTPTGRRGRCRSCRASPGAPAGDELRDAVPPDRRRRRARAARAPDPTWLWGAEHGVNEHRVAIGNEKVWTIDDAASAPPALLGMDLVRLALERAADRGRGLDVLTGLLTHHGQGGSGEQDHDEPYFSSFLLADPTGGWIVETSGRTWAARPVGPGAAISNRISLEADWTRASADVTRGRSFQDLRDPSVPTAIADRRLRRHVRVRHGRDRGSGPLRSRGPRRDAARPRDRSLGRSG